MSLTGFDPFAVRETAGSIISSYNDIMECLVDRMQNEFINEISDKWASPDAFNYFRNIVKPTVDKLIVDATNIYQYVIDMISDAAILWAESTGTDWSSFRLDIEERRINVDCIKKDIDGTIGMDFHNIESVLRKFDSIIDSLDGSLNRVKNGLWNCGFIGGNQKEYLVDLINRISNRIHDDSVFVITGIRDRINKTREEYEMVARQNERKFNYL